ncbi:MAG: adenylyl-sulfate kinase, partial [Betaproteobacteria bacterium]|nr:adenylyl-sulfate kinase [Betaproteobacteria bacterium]
MRGATEGALMTGEGGVLWITGYSGAGKTTIGRKVEARLREQGRATVFLDGDDLRRILAGRWGYERSERLELSKVYFRLCSHLASQGVTVVIAAIAMYEEVYEWMRA